MRIVDCPPLELIKKWGPLAYVDDKERQRILSAPYGRFAQEIKILEREINDMKKKKKSNESEYKNLRKKK